MRDCSISVIIPAYNVEKYLKAALDSIKEQTELPDEVILIDDGSTDGTLEIAKAFELPVPYRVVSIENAGQGNARNLGASLASSEYLHFFDSDDLLTDNFIHSIKSQIRQNQYPDIVLFSGDSFNDNEYQGNRWIDYCRGFSDMFSNRTQFLDKALNHRALFCQPCLYVSRKSLWGPQGLEFGPNFLEDEAVFFPLLFACRTYAVIDEVFFLRRNREGSTMTMAPNAKHVNGALNCMETTLSLYSSTHFISRERWHVRKRLESHCIAYILTARRAGLPVKLGEVFRTVAKSKSLSLAAKALLYGVRADQVNAVRKIGRAVKRVGGFARG
jgi:glycosyltransferase involved in cell wall biosynthesis